MGFISVKPEVMGRKKEWNKHVNEAEADSQGHIHHRLEGHVVEAGLYSMSYDEMVRQETQKFK